ncbi:type IV secretion system protein [Chromobacterium vaccinii]|uniref:type IV secretion system protein n=1 Tax=Chromobacterium vaccinii TaxID=1108595 RepID=UPI003458501C
MADFTVSSFMGSFEAIPQNFLNQVFPALAGAVSTPVYYSAVLYIALYGYSVYAGYGSFTMKDFLAKAATVIMVFATLNWGGFAGQMYKAAVGIMNGAAGVIISGQQVNSTLDGVWMQMHRIFSNIMATASWYNIGIILFGFLIYGVTEVLMVIAVVNMVMAKIYLAIAFSLLPLFVSFAFWPMTRQWFMNCISAILNAILIYVITFALLKFGFAYADGYFQQAASASPGESMQLTLQELIWVVPVFGTLILLLLQVKGWAASLSGAGAVEGVGAIVGAIVGGSTLKGFANKVRGK